MGVGRLPLVAELGHCLLLAVGNEDRIEAEAARPARLVDDSTFEDARPSQLAPLRRDGDQLADVAGTPALSPDAFQLGEQALHVFSAGEPRGLDPWPASEPVDLEAGVLAENPRGWVERMAELRLRPRVLVVRLAGLWRILVGVERLDRPAAERSPELAQLPRILRGEAR
jgi:hypothetical protein